MSVRLLVIHVTMMSHICVVETLPKNINFMTKEPYKIYICYSI